MQRLWREPLLPFLVIAGLLLWLQDEPLKDPQRVEISEEVRAGLKSDFERQRRRTPNAEEMAGLEDAWLEMEVLSREARRLGLDRNDPVVRRRLAQAMRFFLENGLPPEPPSDAEIEAYINENREALALPRRRRFAHLFFSHQTRKEQAKHDALVALERLMSETPNQEKPNLGDAFIHGRVLGPIDQPGLAKRLGDPFAQKLFTLPMGPRWQGPIESSFGFHLIRLLEDKAPGLPEAAVLQAGVRRQLEQTARSTAGKARIEALKLRYGIER